MTVPAVDRERHLAARPAVTAVFALLALVTVALAGVFAPAASASPLSRPQNAVGVIAGTGSQVVGAHPDVLAGECRARAPDYDRCAIGSCVAAETASAGGGAETASAGGGAETEGATTAGEDIVGTSHDALRPTQDWINPAKVDEYAAQLQAGEDVPPIETQRLPNGDESILEGHQRYVASMRTGIPIDRIVTEGPGPVGMPDWSKVFYEPWFEEP